MLRYIKKRKEKKDILCNYYWKCLTYHQTLDMFLWNPQPDPKCSLLYHNVSWWDNRYTLTNGISAWSLRVAYCSVWYPIPFSTFYNKVYPISLKLSHHTMPWYPKLSLLVQTTAFSCHTKCKCTYSVTCSYRPVISSCLCRAGSVECGTTRSGNSQNPLSWLVTSTAQRRWTEVIGHLANARLNDPHNPPASGLRWCSTWQPGKCRGEQHVQRGSVTAGIDSQEHHFYFLI